MKFTSLPLEGAYEVEPEPIGDDRGFFARLFCETEFEKQGISFSCVQMNHSFSKDRGTLRGLHYQLPPFEEVKIVKCLSGKIYDVILDLRLNSQTFGKYVGVELSDENQKMMVVPKGCAHGFLSLTEDTEILYMVSAPYCKKLERGIRWDDPTFSIEWPEEPKIVSERDQSHPDFDHFYHLNIATVS